MQYCKFKNPEVSRGFQGFLKVYFRTFPGPFRLNIVFQEFVPLVSFNLNFVTVPKQQPLLYSSRQRRLIDLSFPGVTMGQLNIPGTFQGFPGPRKHQGLSTIPRACTNPVIDLLFDRFKMNLLHCITYECQKYLLNQRRTYHVTRNVPEFPSVAVPREYSVRV